MNFEDLQKAWQSQDAGAKAIVNADVLLKEVRSSQKKFARTIFWRDAREVGASVVTTVFFLVSAIRQHSWSLYLMSFCCFFVGAFFLVDRGLQRRKRTAPNDPLKAWAEASLHEVNHQIWLLTNIFWWYLLPFCIGFAAFYAQMFAQMFGAVRIQGLAALIGMGLSLLAVGAIVIATFAFGFRFIYRINQRVVRGDLTARRQELEGLLAEIGEPASPPEIKNENMKTTILLTMLLTAVFAVVIIFAAVSSLSSSSTAAADPLLEGMRKKHNLPALAVVVMKDGQICDRAAAGVRKWGESTPVTTNDVFHIGSCTKPMTATLAGLLIDEGKLRWDTTIAEVFPELKGRMDKQYEAVTVEQLLRHRGGVPGEPPPPAWQRAWEEKGSPTQQRREFIEAVLALPPAAQPGTKMIYSNQSVTIVGAMLEKITGQDYENLITEKLFKPLRMDTAGFGPPGARGKADQPWGHIRPLLQAIPTQSDNPPAVAPAARVHCSLDDLARFAMLHLQPSTNGLLKPATLAKLRTPPTDANIASPMENRAPGWLILQRDWAGGAVLWSNGSNTMWYMVMWLAPEKNFAVIAVTNIAGPDAEAACDEAVTAMIHKWLPK